MRCCWRVQLLAYVALAVALGGLPGCREGAQDRIKEIRTVLGDTTLANDEAVYDSSEEPQTASEVPDSTSPAVHPLNAARPAGQGVAGGGIDVYFSNAYRNNPDVGRKDTGNIDRHAVRFIGAARRRLDCALFELESDRIADALIAAKRRGVVVRLVADADYRDNPQMQRVMAAGIPVVFDGRSAFMHNKFLVADSAAVWTGSFNTTDNCAYRNNNNAVVIRSAELAENYAREFSEMFVGRKFGPRSPSNTPHTQVRLGNIDIYNYFAPEDDVAPKVVRILRSARREIRFMAFSFTDTAIGGAMIAAHVRGVAVEGVVEARNADGRGSQSARLARAGITVLPDGNNAMLHHKVIIVDGQWTILGSYNFTASAAGDNDENLLIIKNAAVARAFISEYSRVRGMASRHVALAR